MKKIPSKVLLVLLLSCSMNKGNYDILFKETVKEANGQYLQLDNDSGSFYPNLKKVLLYYNEPFKDSLGKVFISSELFENKELMKNYSAKARDKKWLLEHGR